MKEAVITSSVLILCIILLRKLCGRKISARLRYMLWLIVAVRLIMPGITAVWPNLLPESGCSILNISARMERAAQDYIRPQEPSAYENPPAVGLPFFTEETADGNVMTYLTDSSMLQELIRRIWYLGMAAAGIWMAGVNIRFARKLYGSRKSYIYEKEDLRLSIYTVKNLSLPCLYGLPGRQAIYLPEAVTQEDEKIRHILAHEYCHYRHGDIYWSAFRCILLMVYWFHPLVWLAAILSKQDCELACDEAAIRRLGEEERIAYGRTLVALITRETKAADIVCTATTMTGGTENIRERVRRIAESPRRIAAIILPLLLAVSVVIALTFTKAKNEPEGTYLLEGESSLTVTTSCFQVTFPEELASKTYYRGMNETDIIVYHKDSDLEVGRFCMMFYEEARQLADERDVILIGNYGANGMLGRQIEGGEAEVSVTYHDYTESGNEADGVAGTDSNSETIYKVFDGEASHDYPDADTSDEEVPYDYPDADAFDEEVPYDYPGTDSFSEDTAVQQSSGLPPIPSPESVEREIINLPFQEDEDYNAVDVGDGPIIPKEESSDYQPKESVPESFVYLPDESVTETFYQPDESVMEAAISNEPMLLGEQICYLYIPADYAEADPETKAALEEMNRILIGLADSVNVLSVSREAMRETLRGLVENRTAYVGDHVRVSQIAGFLLEASGLHYEFLALQTTTEPYAATLHYRLWTDDAKWIDSKIPFLEAVLMFAAVENLEICNICIYEADSGMEPEDVPLEAGNLSFGRSQMEELFGPLYSCSQTEESLTDLYNRVLEYLYDQNSTSEEK